MDNAKRFDVRCMSPANTPDGDVWYCTRPIEHEGVHEYQPWHRDERLCRCADEVRCDMRQRIRELEATRNALCPTCNQPHFTLLADKTCLLCSERAENKRLREAIETHRSRITQASPADMALWKALKGG